MPDRIVTNSLSHLLHSARIVPDLVDLLDAGRSCYLVGGALRNVRLGLPVCDFDFALDADPTELARAFASRIGGHWFCLDESRNQSRVVIKTDQVPVSYDFAPWRAATIEEDLRLRDYTVNAQSLPLEHGDRTVRRLFDPLGGRSDLETRILRCCSLGVLENDPLRVLKGMRHCLVLGLHPDENTFAKMTASASHLKESAAERVRAELGQIFSAPVDEKSFDLFARLGLPNVLFGAPGEPGGFAAGYEAMHRAQNWMQHLGDLDKEGRAIGLFDDFVEEYWPRRAVLKLAAFFTGYRPRNVETLARLHLRLGRRAMALLKGLSVLSAQRYDEIDRLPPTTRGRALWVDSLGPGRGEALVLLLALAGADPVSEGPRCYELLNDYLTVSDSRGRIADLVSGDWVRDELRVEDGPRIGELLSRLRSAEIEGRVNDTEEARGFLRRQEP